MLTPPLLHQSISMQQALRMLANPDLHSMQIQVHGHPVIGCLPRWQLSTFRHDLPCVLTRQSDFSYLQSKVEVNSHEFLEHELKNFPPSSGTDQCFTGGIMGWLGYGRCQTPSHHQHSVNFPLSAFGGYDCFIILDAANGPVLYAPTTELLSHLLSLPAQASERFHLLGPFQPLTHPQHYTELFYKVQDYLQSGDCYQVNLAQAFVAECHGDSLDAFLALQSISQPPFAAYIPAAYGDILCLSPELFLKIDSGRVITRPIKGTRPRSTCPDEDQRQLLELSQHPKDRSENLMIVDLLRNDLGKHAKIGSVETTSLFNIESYAHVHHLVSEVQCELGENVSPFDLLFDAFPGGSITGAPKKRAMEIIDELEDCERSVYCGSIGWMSADGQGEWNIAIRTLLRTENRLYAWAGGGIVADSNHEAEYQECLNKIGPLLDTLVQNFLH